MTSRDEQSVFQSNYRPQVEETMANIKAFLDRLWDNTIKEEDETWRSVLIWLIRVEKLRATLVNQSLLNNPNYKLALGNGQLNQLHETLMIRLSEYFERREFGGLHGYTNYLLLQENCDIYLTRSMTMLDSL